MEAPRRFRQLGGFRHRRPVTTEKHRLSKIAASSGRCQTAIYLLTFGLRDYISSALWEHFGEEQFQQVIIQNLELGNPRQHMNRLPSATLTELDFSDLVRLFNTHWPKVFRKETNLKSKCLVRRCISGRNELSHQKMTSTQECDRLLNNLLEFAKALPKLQDEFKDIEYMIHSRDFEMVLRPTAMANSPQMAQGPQWMKDEEDDQLLNEDRIIKDIDNFTKAIVDNPTDATPFVQRSTACCQLAEQEPRYYEYARQDAEDAIERDPSRPSLYHLLGQVLKKLELPYEAVDAYEEGLRVDPKNSVLAASLQNCRARIGETESVADSHLQEAGGSTKNVQSTAKSVLDLVVRANQMRDECKNLQDAIKLYDRAAKMGSPEASFNLGRFYLHGIGLARNAGKALEWLQKAAAMKPWLGEVGHLNVGVVEAQFTLGVMYRDGLGVDVDERMAAPWFEKAALNGHPCAQYSLGCTFLHGNGVVVDYDKAREWLTEAAEKGLMVAQHGLGEMYEKGLGMPVDLELAKQWYQKAADRGHSSAVEALTRLERHKLRMDAENGNVDSLYCLAIKYVEGKDGVPKDLREAERLFTIAAEKGHVEAQHHLANLYAEEMHDHEAAFRWMLRAAENGNTDAELKVALLYIEGRGTRRDPGQASRWTFKARARKVHNEVATHLLQFIDAETAALELDNGCVYPDEVVLRQFEQDGGLESRGIPWNERRRRYFEGIVPARFTNLLNYLEGIHDTKRRFRNLRSTGAILGTVCRAKRSKTALTFAKSLNSFLCASTETNHFNYGVAVQHLYRALLLWSPFLNHEMRALPPFTYAIQWALDENFFDLEAMYCNASSIPTSDPSFIRYLCFCITVHPTRAEFRECYGHFMVCTQRYEKAKHAFSLALKLDKARIEVYFYRAMAGKLQGFQQQPSLASAAIGDFQRYLAMAEPDAEHVPEAHYEMAQIFLYLGDTNRAMHHYELGLAAENPMLRLPIFGKVADGCKLPLKAFRCSPAKVRRRAMANSGKNLSKYPTSTESGLSCFHCLAEESGMQRCASCKIAFYCNASCQKADWKQHKIVCKFS